MRITSNRMKIENVKIIKKIDILIGLVFSVFLALSFLALAAFGLNKKVMDIKHEFTVRSEILSRPIELPQKSDYMLQLKYDHSKTSGENVRLNGQTLELRMGNTSKDAIARYYYISKDIVRERGNVLKVKFYEGSPLTAEIRIKNYISSLADDRVFFTLKGSFLNKKTHLPLFIGGVFFFVFAFCLWEGLVYCTERVFALTANQSVLSCIFSFIPGVLLFSILGLNSFKGPFSLVVQPFFLFLFLFIGVLIASIIVTFLFLFWLKLTAGVSFFGKSKVQKIITSLDEEIPEWMRKSINWFRSREFADKCIFFFIALLILSAFCLIMDLGSWAEILSIIAYISLVIGVTIRIIKTVRDERKNKSI